MKSIEWAEKTWNPITGCSPVSEGCQHCYAKRMATRLKGRFGYPADEPFSVVLHSNDRLTEPLRWRKPRRAYTVIARYACSQTICKLRAVAGAGGSTKQGGRGARVSQGQPQMAGDHPGSSGGDG